MRDLTSKFYNCFFLETLTHPPKLNGCVLLTVMQDLKPETIMEHKNQEVQLLLKSPLPHGLANAHNQKLPLKQLNAQRNLITRIGHAALHRHKNVEIFTSGERLLSTVTPPLHIYMPALYYFHSLWFPTLKATTPFISHQKTPPFLLIA